VYLVLVPARLPIAAAIYRGSANCSVFGPFAERGKTADHGKYALQKGNVSQKSCAEGEGFSGCRSGYTEEEANTVGYASA
jgi:hypothetical protein